MEELDEALQLALKSGDKFNLMERSKYVDTLIAKCVDTYIVQKTRQYEENNSANGMQIEIDHKLEEIINKMFDRCFTDGTFTQAIGIAIESKRLDKVREAIEKSKNVEEMLSYTYTIAQNIVKNKNFRQDILQLLLRIYETREHSADFDPYKIAKCQFFLNVPEATAIFLTKLLKSENEYLRAYQIAFDIIENENQIFLNTVAQHLQAKAGDVPERLEKILKILSGTLSAQLNLKFLKKNSHTDNQIMENIKKSIGEKSSITHGAAIWTNGMMNAFTTNDTFLRDNLNWAARSTNWGRFSATASLGVIHMGNKAEAMSVLNPYFSGGVG